MMHTVLGIVVLVSCFVHDSTTELQEDKAMNVQGIKLIEPRYEKNGLRGFRPGPTQTRLYNHRR